MIKLKTLIEAISPDKSEYEKAAEHSEYKSITVYMDKRGVIHIDDYASIKDPIPHEDTKAKLQLYYPDKRVRIYKDKLHGNKIDSGQQQLLSTLLKKGVIDSSWKVAFSDYEGYYTGGYGSYAHKLGKYEKLPPNFWKRNSRIDLGENLKLYHGTSDLELPTIMKYGLRPLGSKYTMAGHESRIRLEDNKNFLYLAGTFQDAFRYAQTKARSNMLRINKKEYDYVQYNEWNQWFIKPVVLLVQLPDFTKLRSDDDRMISMIKAKASELWKAMDPERRKMEQVKSAEWFKPRGIDYKPEQIEDYLWTISDNGCNFVLTHIDSSEWKNWQASLGEFNQVGYEGVIPPNYIEIIDLMDVISPKDDK